MKHCIEPGESRTVGKGEGKLPTCMTVWLPQPSCEYSWRTCSRARLSWKSGLILKTVYYYGRQSHLCLLPVIPWHPWFFIFSVSFTFPLFSRVFSTERTSVGERAFVLCSQMPKVFCPSAWFVEKYLLNNSVLYLQAQGLKQLISENHKRRQHLSKMTVSQIVSFALSCDS